MKKFFNRFLNLFRSIKITPKKRTKPTSPTDIIYSPAEISTTTSRIIGISLRAFILFLGTFGISAFIADFFALTYNEIYWGGYYIPVGMIALAAFVISAVCGLSAYSRKTALIAIPSFTVLYIAICAIAHGNPFDYFFDSIVRIYNFCLYTMISRGYMYFSDYMITEAYDYTSSYYASSDSLRLGGVFLLTFLIGILLAISVMKKVRLHLLVPICVICLGPTLMYNMSKGTIGFVFTIAFLVACLTVYIYDYRFAGALEAKNERIRKRILRKEEKRQKKQAKKAEKRALREEADKMLMAALKADMGTKKSRLASKAVYKADKLAKKNAKKTAKRRAKTEKKQNKITKKNEKIEIKSLKKQASAGNESAKAALSTKDKLKTSKIAEKKSAKAAKKELKKAERYRRDLVSAAGGIAGIGAAILALLVAGLPALAINKPFAKIEPVYNKVKIANHYVTAYLSGNDIDLNDLSAYGIEELTPRTLSFAPLEYEDIQMFTVSTTADNNVYLKGWAADSYDYYSDTWNGADHDKVLTYRQQFGADFTPDSISTSFRKYVYPSASEITESDLYKNFTKFGFTMQSVTVFRNQGYSRLLFIPHSLDTDMGLLERNSLQPIMKKYSNYYEGIYSSRFFEAGDSHDSVSYITRMNRAGISDEFENAIAYYNESLKGIEQIKQGDSSTYDSAIYNYEMTLQNMGISYIGTSIVDRYFNSMSDEERAEFDYSVKLEDLYSQYVSENYLTSFGSEKIRDLAETIMAEAQVAVETDTHSLVMNVVDYLKSTCTYTLTPDQSLYPGVGSILDAFIFDVQQGYCTHFATAACAILREMGIPARFVEGYIAQDFNEKYGDYTSAVLDSNAHAWIEVYYDGMGWIPYETTPEYYDDMYDPDSATIEPVDPNTPNTPSATPPITEDDPFTDYEEEYEEELTEIQKFIIIVSSVAGAILLYFIGRLLVKRFIRRGVNMLAARYDLIRRARDIDVWNDPKTDRHSMARKINDQIFDIFEVIGAAPESGELSSVYGKRISSTYGDLSKINAEEIFNIIQKEEFGHGLTFDENAMLAEYLADITASVYAGLNRFQKIKYRYIKRKI